MNDRSPRPSLAHLGNLALVAIHIAAAVLIVGGLYRTWSTRTDEVAELERAAQLDRERTHELEHQVAVQEATLDGLHANDPYVIELQARTRLGWTGPHEIRPPPRPDAAADGR